MTASALAVLRRRVRAERAGQDRKVPAVLGGDDGRNVSLPGTVDREVAAWGEDARAHYDERLAIAAESFDVTEAEAERLARREARRVDAGVPLDWPAGIVDDALEAFAGFGLTLDPSPEDPAA